MIATIFETFNIVTFHDFLMFYAVVSFGLTFTAVGLIKFINRYC